MDHVSFTTYKMLTLVELFAGTGAFSLAFEANCTTIYATDKSPSAKRIFDLNIPSTKLVLADIHSLSPADIPEMDVLTAGFPCQPFSIAGEKQGFQDERSTVFWKMMDIIQHHCPRCVVLENVKNILTHDNGNTLKRILQALTDCGYTVQYKVLNTSTYGIPQNRERVYFVCTRARFDWVVDDPVQVRPLSDFLDPAPEERFYYTPRSAIWNALVESVTSRDTVYQYRRTYVRANKSGVCPTLTANMGTGGHNVPIILDDKGIRKLTPQECLRLQGFPSTYVTDGLSNSAIYTLAGNAVTVTVVQTLADQIVRHLTKD